MRLWLYSLDRVEPTPVRRRSRRSSLPPPVFNWEHCKSNPYLATPLQQRPAVDLDDLMPEFGLRARRRLSAGEQYIAGHAQDRARTGTTHALRIWHSRPIRPDDGPTDVVHRPNDQARSDKKQDHGGVWRHPFLPLERHPRPLAMLQGHYGIRPMRCYPLSGNGLGGS